MKKAILLASFGVGNVEAKEKCIDTIVADVKRSFPDYIAAEAWTAVFLRKKLAKLGVMKKSISEALEELLADGVEEVIVQPTHLTQGEEFFKKIIPETESFKGRFKSLKLGKPALFANGYEDYFSVMDMLLPMNELADGEELVMMGHGSPNIHNVVYEWLQQAIDSKGLPVSIGVVEANDHPNKNDVMARLKERGTKKVYLCPLLLCGGEHATVDMAGDEPESWKSCLESMGIEVRCNTSGLGEKAEFRKIYLEHIKEMVNK